MFIVLQYRHLGIMYGLNRPVNGFSHTREFCVLLKYNFMKSKSPQATKEMFNNHYIESVLQIRMVFKLFHTFWQEHMSTSVNKRSRSPVQATISKIINGIHDWVMGDKRFRVHEIVSDNTTKQTFQTLRCHQIICTKVILPTEKVMQPFFGVCQRIIFAQFGKA